MPGPSSSSSSAPSASRRTVLRGAALVPAAGLGITACAAPDDGKSHSGPATPVELGPESELPKGGVKLYRNENVVVSRGKDGSLKGFDTHCTHQGCAIRDLRGTELVCPCHGSKFDATNGQVLGGPASVPLTEVPVSVHGGKIMEGGKA
ncbi:Rieske (2Fe-2S) protein [Streptomyces sp. NPDC002004]